MEQVRHAFELQVVQWANLDEHESQETVKALKNWIEISQHTPLWKFVVDVQAEQKVELQLIQLEYLIEHNIHLSANES